MERMYAFIAPWLRSSRAWRARRSSSVSCIWSLSSEPGEQVNAVRRRNGGTASSALSVVGGVDATRALLQAWRDARGPEPGARLRRQLRPAGALRRHGVDGV